MTAQARQHRLARMKTEMRWFTFTMYGLRIRSLESLSSTAATWPLYERRTACGPTTASKSKHTWFSQWMRVTPKDGRFRGQRRNQTRIYC